MLQVPGLGPEMTSTGQSALLMRIACLDEECSLVAKPLLFCVQNAVVTTASVLTLVLCAGGTAVGGDVGHCYGDRRRCADTLHLRYVLQLLEIATIVHACAFVKSLQSCHVPLPWLALALLLALPPAKAPTPGQGTHPGSGGTSHMSCCILMADTAIVTATDVDAAVLSAVSGLKVAIPSMQQGEVIGIAIVVLVVLFSVQYMGTAKISAVFAPIITVWLLFNAAIGFANLSINGWGVWQVGAAGAGWLILWCACSK